MGIFLFVKNFKTTKANVSKGNSTEIEKYINDTKKPEGYEVITGSCIPYYDFEREYETEAERNDNYATDLEFATTPIQLLYNLGIIYQFTACGFDPKKNKYKNSFHFKIRGVGFHKHAGDIPKIEGFDPVPYNNIWQLFRLPNCSKAGQNRPLTRFGKLHDGEKFEDYIIQNVKGENEIINNNSTDPIKNEKLLKSETAETINNYIKIVKKETDIFNNMIYKSDTKKLDKININFRRTKPTHCDICDRLHEGDGTPYLIVYPDSNKIFYNCHQANDKNSQFLCKIDQSQQSTQSPSNYTIPSLTVDNKTLIYDVPYCSDIPEFMESIENTTHKTIALKSNMGTGKTYATALALNKSVTILSAGVISFRVSLAKKYADDFTGFDCYKSQTERLISAPRWICQLDSLHRVHKQQVVECLIIDEADQARKHLTSKTFMKNSNYMDNRASLKHMIRTAKQVIIMDANLSDDDIDWINSIRPSTNNLTIVNQHIPTKRIINLTTDEAIIRSVQINLNNNEKSIIAHNGSTKKQEILMRTIQKSHPNSKILLINRSTSNKYEVSAALDKPDEEWGKYDVVIYSPTVQSGISYDKKNVFKNVYGIFGNCSNSSGDASQMLHRVRHPISEIINVSITMSNFGASKPTTANGIKHRLTAPRGHILNQEEGEINIQKKFSYEYNNLGEREFNNSEIINEYCKNEAEKNYDSLHFLDNFKQYQLSYGSTITTDKVDKKKDIISKLEVKKSTAEINKEKLEELTNAENIDKQAADAIKGKMSKNIKTTDEEIIQLKKFNLHNLYCLEPQEVKLISELPETDAFNWYDAYSPQNIRNHYYQQSKYFKNSDLNFEEVLETIKTGEIETDRKRRLKHTSEGPEAETVEQCIINTLLANPIYQKHKILIGWLEKFGFTSLISDVEISGDNVKIISGLICSQFDNDTCAILGKGKRKFEAVKKLKITDVKFTKEILKFFNGSLKGEFGITIKKKSKNSDFYILDNSYVKNKLFLLNSSEANSLPQANSLKPILGKLNEWDTKKILNDRYLKVDLPYDSDDEDDN